jgi:ADP-ribosyltransferase exoenzyme
MVDVTPGDSGANKGFWRQQLRDRFGKFVEMGGTVMFDIRLPGVDGIIQAFGKFIGNSEVDVARIEVSDNSRIPKGVYLVKHSDITAVEAVLPDAYVEKETAEAIAERAGQEPVAELKSKITGSEALKIRMKSVARHLKEKGRFPLPRQGSFSNIGGDTDIANGAKLDYKKVFDAEPGLQEKYGTFEKMWDYVAMAGTDLTTQSPNNLNDIPEDMKVLNRAYAKHVLGLNPDGFLTVYRNAVNGKDTEQESAVGYVSLDQQMAWDYNSTRENIGANGRYEIDVRPDEVYGMLGYSRVEDEYGLTIGRGVTGQEGRVRRVGDLEPAKLAPWLEKWNSTFRRDRGESPLRGYGVAGQYDLHEVENFGDNIQEFFQKHNLQASDISAMYDKLYGDGAYAEYKASGNNVSYQDIQKMFIKLDNGKLGLNVEVLDLLQELKPTDEYKNDRFDNVMKMLSVFQELTGDHFMTHKTRDYTPPTPEAEESVNIYDQTIDGGIIDLRALRQEKEEVSKFDLEMFSEIQIESLKRYAQAGYREINKLVRSEEPPTEYQKALIEKIDEAISENGTLFSAARVFRGDIPAVGSDYAKFLENLEEGQIAEFPGYFSTTNDSQIAFSEFGPGAGSGDDDAGATHSGPSFFWTVDLPENGTAMAMPDGVGFRQDAESEVLLPRNTKLRILGVTKVEQVDDQGVSTGRYNHFIHAEQVVAVENESEKSELPEVFQRELEIAKRFQKLGQSPDQLTDKEIQALKEYRGQDSGTELYNYEKLNWYFRRKGLGLSYEVEPKYEEQAAQMDSVFEKSEGLPEDEVVYRGISGRSMRYANLKVGDEISDYGYTSTSKSEGVAEMFALKDDHPDRDYFGFLLEIRIPKGAKVVNMLSALESDPEEYFRKRAEGMKNGPIISTEMEYLLPKNSRFKVVERIEEDEDSFETETMTKLVLELIPAEEQATTANVEDIVGEITGTHKIQDFTRVGPQLGSNAGGTFKDADGNEYYVKSPESEAHRKNEVLASALYRLADVDVAKMFFGKDAEGNEKIFSRIIPGELLADTKLTDETKKQIQSGFAIDAWLANWDVAGLVEDNIVIDNEGRPHRIDVGGSLLFRAQGGAKGDAFGDEVTEIDTLRDPSRNAVSAELFGGMTPSELLASASKLASISPADIDRLVNALFDGAEAESLRKKLKARRNNILSRFSISDGSEPTETPDTAKKSLDYSAIDYEAADFNDVAALQIDNPDQKMALDYYTGEGDLINEMGHAMMNRYLRTKTWYTDTEQAEREAILKKIEDLKGLLNSSIIDRDIKVVRYQDYKLDGATEVGDIWTSDGFLSTATATLNGDEVYNAFTGKPVEIEINIPKGSRGGAVPGSIEAEVLLPPGSKFVVQSIEKVNFRETKIKLLLVGQDG